MKLLEFVIASFLIIILPGQDLLYLISQSININRKAGLYTALGLAAGNIVTISAIAFGITPYIINNQYIMSSLKILGVTYILYLAYRAFTDVPKEIIEEKDDRKDSIKKFFTGVAMNVLNIKAWLFMLLFFPQFTNRRAINPKLDIAILGIVFIVMVIIIFGTIAIIASRLASFFKSEKSNKILKNVSGAMMLIIAFLIIIQ